MAIDDPLDQAEVILANEERRKDPIGTRFWAVASFCKRLADPAIALQMGNVSEAIEKAADGVRAISEAMADDASGYLLSEVVKEIRWLTERFDTLTEEHKKFLNTDWLTLLVDADRKARQTRAHQRVARLAAVLTNAAYAQPSPDAEHVEEMLRTAMNLDNVDVAVLREASQAQGSLLRAGMPGLYQASQLWASIRLPSIPDDVRIFAEEKLNSLGLLDRLGQPNNSNPLAQLTRVYLITKRGLRFVESLKRSVPAEGA